MAVVVYDRPDRKKSPFGVKWSESGKRKFKFFKTAAARDEYLKSLKKAADHQGRAILKLSAADAAIMQECIARAGSAGAVLQAVMAFSGRIVRKPLSEAISEFMADKTNAGVCDDYLLHLKRAFELFGPERFTFADEVTAEDAKAFAAGLGMAPVTVRGNVVRLKVFWNWMLEHKYARENVFLRVSLPKVVEAEPGFLTVAQTEALFAEAVGRFPDAVAYLALGAFAGLRSSATVRLDPKQHIRFEQRGILITGQNAKNSRRQFVDGHEPNLWAWLEWARKHAPEGFELGARMWERRREQVAVAAKVKMPHNALRHSFCTYHCALYGDAGKTATLLTHRGNVAILYEHYKGNATRADAERYFAIRPD